MTNFLDQARPIYVVGIGLHRYQRPSETSYVTLGNTAVREAISDAGISWPDVEAAYLASSKIGMAFGREMLRFLGATGLPITHVENASAGGSTAVRAALLDVAAGSSDVAIAIGVDKADPFVFGFEKSGIQPLVDDVVVPFTHYALLLQEYLENSDASIEQVAQVAVKNHRNGSLNPYAQRQKERSLEEVLAPPLLAGHITRLQCTPIGEGAAAVVLASEEGIRRLGIDRSRAVRITASEARSEVLYGQENFDVALTRTTAMAALESAGVEPTDLDVVEVHDAMAIEEILYLEAIGLAPEGKAAAAVAAGEFDIGGRAAVSASGGLLAMGHPIGPTGVGQIVEVARQLRGEAGQRQHPRAKTGLAHMVGLGAVCFVHILQV
ncbi:thiolase family protein [Nonomuraea sp. NPDC026600]|uniref:thiolase family protein n=1 Tax=Nonomuraea sp. NPDC026600 TaxID=3155363 RepID=UPI0033E954F3